MSVPMSPDNEWPEAWVMVDDSAIEHQCKENRHTPNVAVTAEDMKKLGVHYWNMQDVDKYQYPALAVPWDPSEAMDPKLKQLRDDRRYNYADIITIHPDRLPDYDNKIKSFFEEHIHNAEEIRYILDGSGYFDVRNFDDQWIRIRVKKGDLLTLPEGIYHRFTCDEGHMCQAMRLFQGEPIWTPFNRPQEEHPSRLKYVKEIVEKA